MLKKLGFLIVLITALIAGLIFSPPASWITQILNLSTQKIFTFANTRGSVWSGSVIIAKPHNLEGQAVSILPGRFSWKLSPKLFLGLIEVEIHNPDVLKDSIIVKGRWSNYHIASSTIKIPSEKLKEIGAPFNTIDPSGELELSWTEVIIMFFDNSLPKIYGKMTLDLKNIATKLSPVKPLGHYRMEFEWNGDAGEMELKTKEGPLLLSGKGEIAPGRFQFVGQARADKEKNQLKNLMNLLGQWETIAGEEVIVLKF
tara:strand:+ start:1619 stop:2389 length:771 start_codon:yes stop_codon:yes gene_type:complete